MASARLARLAVGVAVLTHPLARAAVFVGLLPPCVVRVPTTTGEVEGLWSYRTIAYADGRATRLSGLFVFKGGRFVQQALNDGESYDPRAAQVHAGTYAADGSGLKLLVHVGVVVDPTKAPPIESRRASVHHLSAERRGSRLRLTFSTGTLQTLARLGPANGEIITLERGALALVDGYFLLAAESSQVVIAGSGTFERSGTRFSLHGARWLDVDADTVHHGRNESREAVLDAARLRVGGLGFARVRW